MLAKERRTDVNATPLANLHEPDIPWRLATHMPKNNRVAWIVHVDHLHRSVASSRVKLGPVLESTKGGTAMSPVVLGQPRKRNPFTPPPLPPREISGKGVHTWDGTARCVPNARDPHL
jgi:hypothetical protein